MNDCSDQVTGGCNFPENSQDPRKGLKQWMMESRESQVPGSLGWDHRTAWLGKSGEMIYRLLLSSSASGFRNCKWGILFLQNWVGVNECEWGRSHHLYYFPEFSISPSWASLVELSVYIQDIGNPISHNWDIFILYRHFTQLKHTHANGKVLQRYEQSFIAHTLNC